MDNTLPIPKLRLLPFFVIPGLAGEMGQAVARICWPFLFALYLVFNVSQFGATQEYRTAWLLAGAHFGFALAILVSQYRSRADSLLRRITGIVVDHGLFAAMLYFTGAVAAPFVLLPLFFTFGSGLRFGRNYAVYSSLLGSGLICVVLMLSPYWDAYSAIRSGLIVAIICLPLYVFRLTDAVALRTRTDSLTALRNRAGFDELLASTCEANPKANLDSAVVLIDLDGFKRINDELGHDEGDSVLKHVAYWLCVELSGFGTPARIGGDEFAVLVSRLQGRREFEAAVTRFMEHTAGVGKLFDSSLGASVGVYYIEPTLKVAPSFVYKAADQLMYRAKKLGKNQFVISTGHSFSDEGYLLDVDPSHPHVIAPTSTVKT